MEQEAVKLQEWIALYGLKVIAAIERQQCCIAS